MLCALIVFRVYFIKQCYVHKPILSECFAFQSELQFPEIWNDLLRKWRWVFFFDLDALEISQDAETL